MQVTFLVSENKWRSGIRRNEKEWGFSRSVIEQFPRRYHRQGL